MIHGEVRTSALFPYSEEDEVKKVKYHSICHKRHNSLVSLLANARERKSKLICEFKMVWRIVFEGVLIRVMMTLFLPCMLRLWPFPVLKTGMDIRGQVWRSVGKRHFFWSVLAAHPQKDLPKETAGNCSFLNCLNSSEHERGFKEQF